MGLWWLVCFRISIRADRYFVAPLGEMCALRETRLFLARCRLNNRALSELVKSSRSDRSKGEEAVKRPEPAHSSAS